MRTDVSEVKACTFCGHTKPQTTMSLDSMNNMLYRIKCPWCDASGPTRRILDDAINDWNNIAVKEDEKEDDMFSIDSQVRLDVHFISGEHVIFGIISAKITDTGYLIMKDKNGDTGVISMRNVQWISACEEE